MRWRASGPRRSGSRPPWRWTPATTRVAAACAGLQLYLDVTPRGLWRDRLKPVGGFIEEPVRPAPFYHIVCALNELFAA